MLDPKLLLARSITLLYRESLLDNHNDSSVEMIRNVLKDIHTSDNGIGLSEDKKIISGLKNTVLNLCDNYKETFDPRDLIQQVTIACESDTKLLEAIKTAIEADYNESSLKKSVIAIRKQLDTHFREKEIAESFRKASADINFNREKINDLSNYVQEFITKIEPLTMTTKIKDPSILSSIDFGENDAIRKIFQSMKDDNGQARVYRTGFRGLNEMFDGGLHTPESAMNLSLPHNYKSGMSLTLFSQVLRYNMPKTKDKNKIPAMVRISFEDEMPDILKFLFTQMRYTETREYVNFEEYESDFVTNYVTENLQKNGWRVFILRVDPTGWSYKDVFNFITSLEAQGYSIEGLWLDYMGLLPTTGCIQGNAGEALRDMLRRFRNFCAAKGMLFQTPHQLSTEAKALLRGQTTPAMFVKDVAEKGYAAGSKQLDQELDLEFYHHKFSHGKQWYLGIQRGKHRSHMIQDEKKFCILPFPQNLMPIPDDLYDEGPILRRIGASTQMHKEDEDLTVI